MTNKRITGNTTGPIAGLTRRRFVKGAALATLAGPNIITSFSLFGAEGRPGPNSRINVGIIGQGKRGNTWMIPTYLQHMEMHLAAICDVDALKLDFGKQRADALIAELAPSGGKYSPDTYRDFQEVLARPDVDLVDITTPDHWHVPMTLRALKAGKDVVCTKPPTLGMAEGRTMVEYWKRTDRVFTSTEIVQAGAAIKKWIRSGELGKIKEVHISHWPIYFAGPLLQEEEPVPEGLDWDLWCGPAGKIPYHSTYHHHCDPATAGFNPWTRYRPFGRGHLADWGGHRMGPAMWACDLHTTGPVEVTYYPDRTKPNFNLEKPQNDEPIIEWVFANGIRIQARHFDKSVARGNVLVVGENGDTSYEGIKKLDPAKAREVEVYDYKEQGNWSNDIAYSVPRRNRNTLRHPEFSHRIHTACYLADISYQLGGRTIRWNPDNEEIIGDPEASALLYRQYREPWGLEVGAPTFRNNSGEMPS